MLDTIWTSIMEILVGEKYGKLKGDVINYIRTYCNDILGDNLQFSLIFGSFAYARGTSNDIDLLIATKEPIQPTIKTALVEYYFKLHDKLGLTPDSTYPGEYVTLDDIEKSQKGFGFGYNDGVEIPELSCCADWNEFNDPRHSLTAVGGPNIFVAGDEDLYIYKKRLCSRAILGVTLLYKGESSFDLTSLVSSIIGTGKTFMGFPNNNNVRTYLVQHFEKELNLMAQEGLVIEEEGFFSFLDGAFLRDLEKNIKEYNKSHQRK